MYQILVNVALPLVIFMIMAGVGLSLVPDDFRRVARQPKGFFVGALAQLTVLPLVAIVIIALFNLSGELAIGLFILSLCPGGVTSNVFTYLSKGDVGLSISLTAIVGLVTPFTIPILAIWAIGVYADSGQSFKLPILSTWLKLIILTVVPVLLGMWIRSRWASFAIKSEPYMNAFSLLALAVVTFSIVFSVGFAMIDFALIAGPAAFVLNISTMALGYALGRYLLHNEAQARTICLEVGLQNGTLAILITTTLLQSLEMAIAPSIYSLLMIGSATMFTYQVYKRRTLNEARLQQV